MPWIYQEKKIIVNEYKNVREKFGETKRQTKKKVLKMF